VIKEIEQFAQRIQAEYPDAKVSVTAFPSGALTLDIDINSVSVEMAYTPNEGFGVSLVDATTAPFTGHDEVFPTFAEAKGYILQLVGKSLKVSP
jgi:hypothetical protein